LILIVPCCEKGKGGGHLTRCMSLANDLHASGRNVRLFITPQTRDLTSLYKLMSFNPALCITDEELIIKCEELEQKINFIILDNFQTSDSDILRWKKMAPVIGIDEGGASRDKIDFLLDILIPENFIKPSANIFSPGFLFKNVNIDKRKKSKSDLSFACQKISVLVTFGQEDSAALGIKTALALSYMHSLEITLLMGALVNANAERLPENVRILENIPNLAKHLYEYDIVITHYGITAYEALYAGCIVLLDHPSELHKRCAKSSGFQDFKSKYFIERLNTIKQKCELLAKRLKLDKENSFSAFVNGLNPQVNKECPVCKAEIGSSICRFNDRTYRLCSKCGIIHMDRINTLPFEYAKEYFFDSYVKQYGKTYLEDFNNIKIAARGRLKNIKSLFANVQGEPSLLDIGCAYGPFLSASKEEGFSPNGIEPSQDAVNYVKDVLLIPAVQGFFPGGHNFKANSFNVITLWYVIEHFKNCVAVFSEIKKLLKPDGILAFSTPSFSGVSGRKNLRRFLNASPADHFTVWSPKMCKKALSLAGFKVKKIDVIGHHPERFPFLGRFAKSRTSPLFWLLLAASKLFALGDTFEVYAQNKD